MELTAIIDRPEECEDCGYKSGEYCTHRDAEGASRVIRCAHAPWLIRCKARVRKETIDEITETLMEKMI